MTTPAASPAVTVSQPAARIARPAARPQRRPSWQVWLDRAGRLSWPRVFVLILLLWPLLEVANDYGNRGVDPRLYNDLIHRTGYWALIFFICSLAVTPLRRVARYGKLIDVRRMIGVGAFCYIFAHLTLYVIDLNYDIGKVATEIVVRLYLTIGFIAWLGLATMAATSTDAMVRRLGGMTWRRVHQVTYVVGILALIHFFQQTKADVTVPVLMSALFGWLIGYRLIAWWRRGEGDLPPLALLGLTVAVSALTFILEAVGIGLHFNISPMRILNTVFDFRFVVRPGWWVLAAGLAVVVLDLVRRYQTRPSALVPRQRP